MLRYIDMTGIGSGTREPGIQGPVDNWKLDMAIAAHIRSSELDRKVRSEWTDWFNRHATALPKDIYKFPTSFRYWHYPYEDRLHLTKYPQETMWIFWYSEGKALQIPALDQLPFPITLYSPKGERSRQ